MKTMLMLLLLVAPVVSADIFDEIAPTLAPPRLTLLEVFPNDYGLGLNRDQYARPHVYRLQDWNVVPGIFNGGVKRDAYGLGVHMDQFARPVYDSTILP